MNLKIHTFQEPDVLTLRFEGILDETCELPEFQSSINGRLTVDLEKLAMINSLGCRKWIQWIRTLPPSLTVTLKNCSPVVVNQINILSGFIPARAVVESILVPYYCAVCDLDDSTFRT